MNMLRCMLVLVGLLFVFGLPLHAQDASSVGTSHALVDQLAEPVAGFRAGGSTLLWDNTAIMDTASAIVSNDLRGRHPDSSLVQSADDFVIPPGVQWSIDSVYTEGLSNQVVLPDSFAVVIYNTVAGFPGTQVYRSVLIPSNGISMTIQRMRLPVPAVLGPGRYWLSVYAVFNTGTSLTVTRWNWKTGAPNLGIEQEAKIRDFTGLFGIPPFPWTNFSALGVNRPSVKFALFGTSSTAGPQTFTSRPNRAIPDNNPAGIRDTISTPALNDISKVQVVLDTVLHTWVGDLTMNLTSPRGESIWLMYRPGSGTFGSSGDNFIGTIFDDTASIQIENILATGSPPLGPPYTGYFRPDSAGVLSFLSVFDGNQPAGGWVLNVADNAAADLGTLVRWSIVVHQGAPAVPMISVSPDSIGQTLNPGDSVDVSVTIQNVGTAPLNWSAVANTFASRPVTLGASAGSIISHAPGAGEIDRRWNGRPASKELALLEGAFQQYPTDPLSLENTTVVYVDSMNGANDTTALKARGYKVYYRGTGPQGTTAVWFQGNAAVFPAFNGPPNGYVAANYNAVTGTNTIDNWLVLPARNIQVGDTIGFYERSPAGSTWPDSIRVMYSAAGDSVPEAGSWVELGRFKTTTDGSWMRRTFTSAAPGSNARFAIRYRVANGGPTGANSDYIGIDMITITRGGVVPPAPWLRLVGPTSGTIGAGASATLTARLSAPAAAALRDTVLNGSITITSNDPANPTVNIPVTLNVTTVQPPLYSFFDNFDSYTAGVRLVTQNPTDWQTWSGGAGTVEDPFVSNAQSFSNPNSVVIVHNNDLVKRYPSFTSGKYRTTWRMYIPSGKAGYFNTMAGFTPNPLNWGMQVFFNSNGTGSIDADGQASALFTYTQNQWHTVDVVVNLNIDSAYFYLNNSLIRRWRWTRGTFGGGSPLRLDASSWYGATANDQMYIDNFHAYQDTTTVGVDDDRLGLPQAYALTQNFPNPFNPVTTIRYALPFESNVTVSIYNLVGQEVARLVNGQQTAGYYEIVWDSRNTSGVRVGSGVYFYRIHANPLQDGHQPFVDVKKMILLK